MKWITKERFSVIDAAFISVAAYALGRGYTVAYVAVAGAHLVFLFCQSFWGVRRLRCWWFGHEQHPHDSAPPDQATCMHCGEYVPYRDMVSYTRHTRLVSALRYWLWRRWVPVRCIACGGLFRHRADCDRLPF